MIVGLADKSTALGVWSLSGSVPIAVTARVDNLNLSAVTAVVLQSRVTIDATRTLLLIGGGANNLYTQVHDSSTGLFGAPLLVRSAAGLAKAILSAANQVLVCSCDATTAMQFVTITLAGTGQTLNTMVPITLAGTIGTIKQLVAVGVYFIVSYDRTAPVAAIRAISILGTAPSISTESTTTAHSVGSTQYTFAASATVVLTSSYNTAGTTIYVKPFTVGAGPTLAAGTETSVTADGAEYRMVVLGTRWAIVYGVTSLLACAIVNLAGTVASNSAVTTAGAITSNFIINTDYWVTGSKLLVAWTNGASLLSFQIFTDSAGVISQGTLLAWVTGAAVVGSSFAWAYSSGALATFYGSATAVSWTIDTSTASPTMSRIRNSATVAGQAIALPNPPVFDARSATQLRGSNVTYTLPLGVNGDSFYVTAAGVSTINKLRSHPGGLAAVTAGSGAGIAGAANEAWQIGNPGTGPGTVISLQRIECAA